MDKPSSEYCHSSLYSQCLELWLAIGTSKIVAKSVNDSINEAMNLGTTSLDNTFLKCIPVLPNVIRHSTVNGF